MSGIIARFFFIPLFLFIALQPAAALEQGQLLQQPADVEQVMDHILGQHIEKHQMNPALIRNSFRIFIQQFDPQRTYLLEKEVAPYLQMRNEEAERILVQYRNHDFSAYEQLNSMIQKAILRARDYRSSVDARALLSSYDYRPAADWVQGPAEGSQPYAQTLDELRERQYQQLVRFVAAEKQRYGEAQVAKKKDRLIDIYNSSVSMWEDGYLFLNPQGKPLAVNEQKNLFYMHVLKSLAHSLDNHTTVFNANEAYDMRVRLEKAFDGVGIVIKQGIDGYFVKRLLSDSPAARSGALLPNDQIIAVDGQAVSGMPVQEVMQLLRGKEGSSITLQLARNDQKIEVKLVREPITVNEGRVETSFEPYGDGIIGLIKLHAFYQGKQGVTSEHDLRQAINELDKQGNLRGLILDLRDNSGGFLTQAVKVAGLFITNGVVVISKYSNGEEHYYRDMDGKVSYSGPLIVLTSPQTASAAEIVAQALQDYGVALVVGDEQTYGKGTIQSQTVTEKEGGSYFKVTVGKYYTVSGKTPQKHGVKSDILVPGFASGQNLKEVIDYPPEATIPPAYQDKLQDIDPGLRPWYMRYYIPTLQQKSDRWRQQLPELRSNSEQRIAANGRYQSFLNGDGTIREKDILEFDDVGDPQLQEAVNIVKDMITLESQSNTTEAKGGSEAQ